VNNLYEPLLTVPLIVTLCATKCLLFYAILAVSRILVDRQRRQADGYANVAIDRTDVLAPVRISRVG
jgi:hypothetical protein